MTLREIIKTSRPHFWIYEGATFLGIGVIAGIISGGNISILNLFIFSFYFFIPANILIYGINDIYDYETDKQNPKKLNYEGLITPEKRKPVFLWIIFTTLPFLFFIPLSKEIFITFIIFLFFAIFYSAPPIRAKAIPFLDSFFSAGHYVATGVFGYFLAGGTNIPWIGIFAGMTWAIAMHAYSAIPDIQADSIAKIKTIATTLGKKNTLILCGSLYLASSISLSFIFPIISLVLFIIYEVLIFISFKKEDKELFKIYTYFPFVNAIAGAIISMKLISILIL